MNTDWQKYFRERLGNHFSSTKIEKTILKSDYHGALLTIWLAENPTQVIVYSTRSLRGNLLIFSWKFVDFPIKNYRLFCVKKYRFSRKFIDFSIKKIIDFLSIYCYCFS